MMELPLNDMKKTVEKVGKGQETFWVNSGHLSGNVELAVGIQVWGQKRGPGWRCKYTNHQNLDSPKIHNIE